MSKPIYGKPIAEIILKQAEDRVFSLSELGKKVKLVVILVGDDTPSMVYAEKKAGASRKIGIDFTLIHLPHHSTTEDVIEKIKHLQTNDELSGLIVQLPLPKHIDTPTVINSIDPNMDADCLTDENLGKLVNNTAYILPPTPAGVFSILQDLDIDVAGKNITIVGMGPLVGKPLTIMMMNRRASVTTCNSLTIDTKEKCLNADIIITGVGKRHLITSDMVSRGTIVIDTGVEIIDGKIYGDIDYDGILQSGIASHITPTPGGTGPLTVAHLILNTALLAEHSYKKLTT